MGTQSWVAMGAGGPVLLLLGLASLALVWTRRFRLLAVTAGLSALLAWWNFLSFQSQIARARSSAFGGLGASMVSLQFGFYLVLLATLVTLAAAVLGWRRRQASRA